VIEKPRVHSGFQVAVAAADAVAPGGPSRFYIGNLTWRQIARHQPPRAARRSQGDRRRIVWPSQEAAGGDRRVGRCTGGGTSTARHAGTDFGRGCAAIDLRRGRSRRRTPLPHGELWPLWGCEREGWARRFFENWRASLKWQRLKPYEKFAEMIDRGFGHSIALRTFDRRRSSFETDVTSEAAGVAGDVAAERFAR
jgi:hypothetical protein